MSKIKLLLSGNTNLQYYLDAVREAGAEPFAKYLPEIDTGYDGLILCGGNDIDPSYYNEAPNGATNIDKARDEVEFSLLKAYIDAGKPVLGICRGCQLINVFFGGTLFQDLPDAHLHTNKTDFYIAHPVSANQTSVLSKLYGTTFSVNSCHHQAVNKLGEDLRATAYWDGRYIEAYEHRFLPILAVQWHPERMCAGEKRADTVDGIEIFKHFVAMCKDNK